MKRAISAFLVFLLVFSLMPKTAFAETAMMGEGTYLLPKLRGNAIQPVKVTAIEGLLPWQK